jgi:hypothetical protein
MLLLEYADGKPMKEVGWGRASARLIEAVLRSAEQGARQKIVPPAAR